MCPFMRMSMYVCAYGRRNVLFAFFRCFLCVPSLTLSGVEKPDAGLITRASASVGNTRIEYQTDTYLKRMLNPFTQTQNLPPRVKVTYSSFIVQQHTLEVTSIRLWKEQSRKSKCFIVWSRHISDIVDKLVPRRRATKSITYWLAARLLHGLLRVWMTICYKCHPQWSLFIFKGRAPKKTSHSAFPALNS